MDFSVRLHRAGKECIVAACDESLLGKELGDEGLRFKVGDFYRSRLVAEEEMRSIMRTGTVLNLVGDAVVELAVREGLVDRKRTRSVVGVACAQTISM